VLEWSQPTAELKRLQPQQRKTIMDRFFKNLLGTKTTKRNHKPTDRPVRLGLETLEDRLTPANYVAYGELFIVCGTASDTVTVTQFYQNTWGYYRVTENGVNTVYRSDQVPSGGVSFYGYQGNDYFRNDTSLRTTAYGHDGNDTLIGGVSNDKLYGEIGSDTLYGRGSDDLLIGGNDYNSNDLFGGDGSDTMTGGYGADYMYGGNDADVLYGNYGNDYLFGEGGRDTLYGQDGSDLLSGGLDGYADYLNGGPGDDTFQIEYYWNGYYYANRDAPADFGYNGDRYIT
jgi:Ca2+-binding RTX toxin-like protein